jgi:LysM repeat protein
MKGFLVSLVIVAVVGGVAWQQGFIKVGGAATASAHQPSPPPVMGSAVAGDSVLPPPPHGGHAPGQLAQSTQSASAGQAVDLGQTVREAAVRYAELAAHCDPTRHPEVVGLARVFSAALQATYGLPPERGASAQAQLLQYLEPIGASLFFSTTPYDNEPTGFVQRYTFQSGDNLGDVGRRFGMSVEYINMLRGRAPDDGLIHAGAALKVFNVKESGYLLHVDKSSFTCDLYIGGIFAKRYSIGHGAPGSQTPSGTSHIHNRSPEPSWTPPGSSVMLPYGHPDHIIGRYWLGIDPQIGKAGLGFHGYTGQGPATGGMYSNGCIRMQNDDMAEVYRILVPCMLDSQGRFITRAPMAVTIAD